MRLWTKKGFSGFEKGRLMAADFVQRTGFEGIAPLPAEARFTVAYAKKLPEVVE